MWQALAAQGMAQGLGKLDSALTGMATAGWADKRQIRQSKKLMALEAKYAKDMAQYNQSLALDMWNKTNFPQMREQMEKAGLNIGLMYEGGGAGGTTQGAGRAEAPSAGHAPAGGGEIGMAMQIGLQQQMQAAQIANIQADTKKKEVEANKLGGVDTQEKESTIELLKQNQANAAIQNNILQYEEAIKKIETGIAETNQWDIMRQMSFATMKLEGEARKAAQEGKISEDTAKDVIHQTKTISIEQALRISAQKAGITNIGADTAKKLADRQLGWMQWEQREKERWVQENILKLKGEQTQFDTSTANQIKQWTSIITDALKAIQ